MRIRNPFKGNSKDNSKVLEEGFSAALYQINSYYIASLCELCARILRQVEQNREFMGWSGNTQQSYMGAVYANGKLVRIINQKNWNRRALRKKLKNGEWGFLRNPYEGEARSVQGKVDTDGGYGKDTSLQFLYSYKRCPKNGYAIVITTGTEYSEYLEQALGLDVLTKTFTDAPIILQNGFKPIGK